LNYFLSDQQAQLESGDGTAAGLLLAATENNELSVTETSAANALIVERTAGGSVKLVSPPQELILGGISLRRTLRLAQQLGLAIRHEPISIARAEAADELLLTGTTGCIWPAAALNERLFTAATAQPVYQALAEAWKQDIDADFTQLPARDS
jgi:branched-subunit amino acid aminotransferase/4-amino-4-deoxychorismate lyase